MLQISESLSDSSEVVVRAPATLHSRSDKAAPTLPGVHESLFGAEEGHGCAT